MAKKKVKPKQKEEPQNLQPENDSGSDTLPMVPISSRVNTEQITQPNVPPHQRVRDAQNDCCCTIC